MSLCASLCGAESCVDMAAFAATRGDVVAIDGKSLRRSFDRAAGTSPLLLVSAWASQERLVLAR